MVVPRHRLRGWARTQRWRLAQYHQPTSEEELVALALEMDGRPHRGKVVNAGRKILDRVIPQLAAFDILRRRLDPHGRGANPFINRVLGEVTTVEGDDPGSA